MRLIASHVSNRMALIVMYSTDFFVKFDGKDIKESRDRPRLVASMPVGRSVDVVVVREGKEVTKTVTLGRLEDGEK